MTGQILPSIGIMQGRLVPPVKGRIQAFPSERWRDEFALAQQAGLQAIEWIYDLDDAESRAFNRKIETSGDWCNRLARCTRVERHTAADQAFGFFFGGGDSASVASQEIQLQKALPLSPTQARARSTGQPSREGLERRRLADSFHSPRQLPRSSSSRPP